jgi:hypothetical protein
MILELMHVHCQVTIQLRLILPSHIPCSSCLHLSSLQLAHARIQSRLLHELLFDQRGRERE